MFFISNKQITFTRIGHILQTFRTLGVGVVLAQLFVMMRISIPATLWMMAMVRSALALVLAVALVRFCAGIGITVAVCQRIIFRIYVFIFWNNLGVLTCIDADQSSILLSIFSNENFDII